jgi:TPR repeat protein
VIHINSKQQFFAAFLLSAVLIVGSITPAFAVTNGFTGEYDPSNWTFSSDDAEAFVDTTNAPDYIILSGPDEAGGEEGPEADADFTITIPSNGFINFDWEYETTDDPTYDFAKGYLFEEARNYKKALELYIQAGKQSFGGAQFNLGVIYANGEWVTRDLVQAYKWFYLASRQNVDKAADTCADLARYMTPEQVTEAKRLADQP